MIAHVAIRRVQLPGNGNWLYAYGWVMSSASGAGIATTRHYAVSKACIEATSTGARMLCLPHPRDWASVPAPIKLPGSNLPGPDLSTHEDPTAVAVATRAASVKLMREFILCRGFPDLSEAAGAIAMLGGPETVAAVIGCDAAQVCRWARAGKLPAVRVEALRRELEAIDAKP